MPTTVIVRREVLGQTKMHVFGALRSARAMAFIITLSLLILLIKYHSAPHKCTFPCFRIRSKEEKDFQFTWD